MTDPQQQQVWSAVRILLGAAGGYLVGAKLISADVWAEVLGAIMTLLPIAWGAWSHSQDEAKTQAREAVAVNAGIAAAQAGVVPAAPPPPSPAAPTAAEIIKTYAAAPQVAAPAVPAPKPLPFGVAKP